MRKISLILVSLLMVGNLVFAQNPGRMNRETAQEMTERMVKSYSLDDNQKTQLLEINQKYMEESQKRFEAMRGQGQDMSSEQRDKLRQEMTASREAYNEKLQKLFTEEQYKAYQKDEQERQARRRQQ